MKSTIQILLVLCMATWTMSAQNSETRSLGDFKGIHISSSVDAEIRKGNTNEAKITVRNLDLDEVVTEIEDGHLYVSMKKRKKWSWKNGTKLKVEITYTDDPSYISVSSSADLIAHDVIKVDELELKTSSSSDTEIEVDVNSLIAKVSSSSDVEIEGRADKAKVNVSSSSDFMGQHLKVKDAVLNASSSSDIEISVSESIKAKATSSSDILYYGSPSDKDISKSSSGDVHRKRG